LGRHDTLTTLLGFAEDHPRRRTDVIEVALEVDPTLMTRCLPGDGAPEPHRSGVLLGGAGQSA
jgi:hypothetical protein